MGNTCCANKADVDHQMADNVESGGLKQAVPAQERFPVEELGEKPAQAETPGEWEGPETPHYGQNEEEPEPLIVQAEPPEDLHLEAANMEEVDYLPPLGKAVESRLQGLGRQGPDRHPELAQQFQEGKEKTLRDKETGGVYQGKVHRGVPHGWGKVVGADGSYTEGFFQEGKPSLWVRRISPSGLVYAGEIRDDQAHGKGVQTEPSGRTIDCQTWVRGEPEGYTVVSCLVGGKTKTVYRGGLKKGKKHGEGTFYFEKTKTTYSGTFVEDLLQGRGKAVGENGESYQGEFKNGQENGQGAKIFVDGRMFKGKFLNGKPHGEGLLTNDQGEQIKVTFKEGKRVQ